MNVLTKSCTVYASLEWSYTLSSETETFEKECLSSWDQDVETETTFLISAVKQ